MKEADKNIIYILAVILITFFTIIIVFSIPGYLRGPSEDTIGMQPKFIIVFLIVDIILIGIPEAFHKLYVNDYSKIKNIWFFAIFGGITGGLMGEKSFIMILPYTILMLIYAFLYKKFPWWKIAITSYLGGVLIENVMNRSPIQSPTSIWIAFFVYPYFVTKIFENRKKLNFWEIIKDLKYVFITILILFALIKFVVKSIPIAFALLAITLPILFSYVYRIIKQRKKSI
jgi:hypothetical protein